MDADSVAYLGLEGLTGAVQAAFEIPSCYTGVYPVALPRDEAKYLQLALKLNPEPAAAAEAGPCGLSFEKILSSADRSRGIRMPRLVIAVVLPLVLLTPPGIAAAQAPAADLATNIGRLSALDYPTG